MTAELVPQRRLTSWWGRPDGNDWVYVPGTTASDGLLAIPELDVLHEGQRGLLRLVGGTEPLVTIAGDGLRLSVRRDTRGLTVDGGRMRITITWAGVVRHVLSPRFLPSQLLVNWDPWRRALTCEAAAVVPLAACSVVPHGEVTAVTIDGAAVDLASEGRASRSGEPVVATIDCTGPVHLGVGADVDAVLAGVHALRRSIDRPAESGLLLPAGSTRRAADNLWFCRLAALGRAIDTGAWMPVTSRSPRHELPGAFRARDWFRWALPALCLADPAAARAGLLAGCRLSSEGPGTHVLDLAGRPLYPGFCLDQAADVALGVETYLSLTADDSVLADPDVEDALAAVGEELPRYHDAHTGLFRSELSPSGEVPPGPFLAVPNARAALAYEALARHGVIEPTPAVRALRAGWPDVFVRGGWIAGALGLDGQTYTWDDPWCSVHGLAAEFATDPRVQPAWAQTTAWLASRDNPDWRDGGFGGEHQPGTVGASLVPVTERLLANPPGAPLSELARATLERAPLDGGADSSGFACEAFDAGTGAVAAGPAFAGGAGILARGLFFAHGLT